MPRFKRRASFGASRARRSAPGKSFWLRPPAFTITERQQSNGVFSDLVLTESDFINPSIALNDTKRGAPVIERLIIDIGFAQTFNQNYFDPAQFGQVTMLVEAMVWTQNDTFVSHVTDSATFDSVLQNQRILGYGVMDYTGARDVTGAINQMSLHRTFEPRVKVKIREMAVGVAIRTNFGLGNASSLANFPWVQPTLLVRVP